MSARIEVPLDVQTAAARIVGTSPNVAAERALVVQGVLEERERCAKAAEGFEDTTRDWVPGSLYDNLRRDVANAIRKGAA